MGYTLLLSRMLVELCYKQSQVGCMGSENFSQNVVLFMCVGVQTLELAPLLVAFLTEEEVVAVLAHPAVL